MSNTNTGGGPAFPCEWDYIGSNRAAANGMTLRQYAAIHLKVPNSGTDWLDDMIRKAQLDELAAKAMQSELSAMCQTSTEDGPESVAGLPLNTSDETLDMLSKHWYRIAEAMQEAGEK